MAKKESITCNEYLQLLGLAVIADRHVRGVMEAESAAQEILGTLEDPHGAGGWIGDAFWSGESDVDNILKKMEVRVREEEHHRGAVR